MARLHRADCTCCTGQGPTRRGLLGAFAALGALSILPRGAPAGEYAGVEACLINCMDPRITEDGHTYMSGRGWNEGDYSQIALAGGPIAAVAPAFVDWHKAVWDNLAATVQLHAVHRLIALSHRDCGAVRIAFGPEAAATVEIETANHTRLLLEFRRQVAARHPDLVVETGIMTLDGSVLMVS
ncbi:hypothetical protein STVA_07970 [Allostella vacuolata]|nr:hypothetical protein STVA_07970 [Stella vacuolata]